MTDATTTQSTGSGATPGSSPALVPALRRVLRPLVRLMLSRGINYTYLAELLKGLFVEVADTDFRIDGKQPTDSRISLLSGVHRKDVSRLRAAQKAPGETDSTTPAVVSFGAQLVANWLALPQYQDEAGKSRPLPRFASEGGAISFESLVSSVSSDIRSRVVLDEWLRLGIVHLDEERRVCLNADAFVPSQGFEEKLVYFEHNLHDHAAASVFNLLGVPANGEEEFVPFVDRSVHYDELSPESVRRLAEQSQALGMKALLAVNKSAIEAENIDRQAAPDQPRQRMTFGIYFYTEPASPTSTDEGSNR